MKYALMIAAVALIGVSLPEQAHAIGCPTGAAAGATAGHFVGKGHAILGGIAGCVAGHHLKKKRERQQDQRDYGNQNDRSYNNGSNYSTGDYHDNRYDRR